MEVMVLCVTIGILMCTSMLILGITIGREVGKHERDSECSVKYEHTDRTDHIVASMGVGRDNVFVDQGQFSIRCDDRQNIRQVGEKARLKHIKRMNGEQLANAMRVMCLTGICPSDGEKDLLYEVAERLDKERANESID